MQTVFLNLRIVNLLARRVGAKVAISSELIGVLEFTPLILCSAKSHDCLDYAQLLKYLNDRNLLEHTLVCMDALLLPTVSLQTLAAVPARR